MVGTTETKSFLCDCYKDIEIIYDKIEGISADIKKVNRFVKVNTDTIEEWSHHLDFVRDLKKWKTDTDRIFIHLREIYDREGAIKVSNIS